jgi:hypothetical protein
MAIYAEDCVDALDFYISTTEWYEEALYVRRSRDRLRETKRVWTPTGYENVRACEGWEREVCERQILRYVLDHGYFPDEDHVKILRKNAQTAKRELPKPRPLLRLTS